MGEGIFPSSSSSAVRNVFSKGLSSSIALCSSCSEDELHIRQNWVCRGQEFGKLSELPQRTNPSNNYVDFLHKDKLITLY